MSQSCRGFSFTDTALRCPAFISVHYHKILPYLDETADTSIFLLYLPISAEGPLCTSQEFYLVIYFTGRTKNKEMLFTPPTYFDCKPFKNTHTEQSNLEGLLWNMHLSSHHGEQVGM